MKGNAPRLSAPAEAIVLLILMMTVPATPASAAQTGQGLALLAGLATGATSGHVAPAFELPDIEGGLVGLRQFQGERPVLLYFWATWCPSCKAVRPELIKIRERVREEDLAILAINVGSGDSLEKVKRYQQSHPLPMKVLYDNEGRVTASYAVQGIPLFVLIDREGRIVFRDHQLPQDLSNYLKNNP